LNWQNNNTGRLCTSGRCTGKDTDNINKKSTYRIDKISGILQGTLAEQDNSIPTTKVVGFHEALFVKNESFLD